MIIFISDLDLRGSGYMNIAIALLTQLAERGYESYALGIGYKGDEHNWPFSINPVETKSAFQHIHAMLNNVQALAQAGQFPKIDGIVTALDIPQQEMVLRFPRGDIPYCGIFPIESGPLCPAWANVIAQMDERLVISKFGHEQIVNAGLKSTYIPIGIDTEAWRPPSPSERKMLRSSLGYDENDFVVLTVADNQERKNLAAAAQMMGRLKADIPIKWMLVTRVDSRVGWELGDPPFDLGPMFTQYERGLPFDRLWTLYAVADAFLLTSKAEGLCMPVVEAMATGTPVAATNCTAIPEHLVAGEGRFRPDLRGFPIEVEFVAIDPWGNSERSFVSVDDGVRQLRSIYKKRKRGKLDGIIQAGVEYAESRTWSNAGDVLEAAVRRMTAKARADKAEAKEGTSLVPPTLPQRVPVLGADDEQE